MKTPYRDRGQAPPKDWADKAAAKVLADFRSGTNVIGGCREVYAAVAAALRDAARVREIATPATSPENEVLHKRPVAFRVPNGDGWTLLESEKAAQFEASARGVDYHGLYVRK
jgi:hypothetical protein